MNIMVPQRDSAELRVLDTLLDIIAIRDSNCTHTGTQVDRALHRLAKYLFRSGRTLPVRVPANLLELLASVIPHDRKHNPHQGRLLNALLYTDEDPFLHP